MVKSQKYVIHSAKSEKTQGAAFIRFMFKITLFSLFRLKIDENSTIFNNSKCKKNPNYIPNNLALSPEPESIKKLSKHVIY